MGIRNRKLRRSKAYSVLDKIALSLPSVPDMLDLKLSLMCNLFFVLFFFFNAYVFRFFGEKTVSSEEFGKLNPLS